MPDDTYADFEIMPPEGGTSAPGAWHASARAGLPLVVSVVPAEPETVGRISHTRIMQPFKQPTRKRSVLVCRLGDARLYIEGNRLILTDEEVDIR